MHLFLYILTISASHDTVNNRHKLFDTQDPALLLVNKMYPTRPLTIYDTENEESINLPVGMSELQEESFPFQLFHSYYEGYLKNFYLQWNGDKKTRVVPEGDYLQARRGQRNVLTGMTAHSIPKSEFIKIMSEGKCLQATEKKSKYRDAYPLKFLKCTDSEYQKFKFVSHIKASCVLGLKECTQLQSDIFMAEEVIRNRVEHFILNK